MEVGGFKRVVVKDEDSQLDINSKIVSSVNINFDRLYKAMNGGIDFSSNITCGILSVVAKHGQEQNISHNLSVTPQNITVMSGLAKISMLSSSLKTIKIKTFLSQTSLTKDTTGNTITVLDPYSFSSGDAIVLQRTGDFSAIEATIDSIDLPNRNIKLKTSVQASANDIVYKKEEVIKLLVF